jgi:hypothetical protein
VNVSCSPPIETHEIKHVPCKAGNTSRMLQASFGGDFLGKEILWKYDDLGLTLDIFVAVELLTTDESEELIREEAGR